MSFELYRPQRFSTTLTTRFVLSFRLTHALRAICFGAFAGLKSELVLVGVRDHIEIWDADRWKEFLGQRQSEFDQWAERAFAVAHLHTLPITFPKQSVDIPDLNEISVPSYPR